MKVKMLKGMKIFAAYMLAAMTFFTSMPQNVLAAEIVTDDFEIMDEINEINEEIDEVDEVEASDEEVTDIVKGPLSLALQGPSTDYYISVDDMKNISDKFYDEDGHKFNDTFSLDGESGHKVQSIVFGKGGGGLSTDGPKFYIAGTEVVDTEDTLVLFRDGSNSISYRFSDPAPDDKYKSSYIYNVINSNVDLHPSMNENIHSFTTDALRSNIVKGKISYKEHDGSAYSDAEASAGYMYLPDGEVPNDYITVGYDNSLKIDGANWPEHSAQGIWLRSDYTVTDNALIASKYVEEDVLWVSSDSKDQYYGVAPALNLKLNNVLFASRVPYLAEEGKKESKDQDTAMTEHDGNMYIRYDAGSKIASTIDYDKNTHVIRITKASSGDPEKLYMAMQYRIGDENTFTVTEATEDETIDLDETGIYSDLSNADDIKVWLEYWDMTDKMAYAKTPVRDSYTCRIGAKAYTSLKTAVDSITTSAQTTISMMQNETLSDNPFGAAGSNRNVVIDLKGKTLNCSQDIVVQSTDNVTFTGKGSITNRGFRVRGGNLIVDGPTIDVGSYAAITITASGGHALIKSGVFNSELYTAVENGITIKGGYFTGTMEKGGTKPGKYVNVEGGYFIKNDAFTGGVATPADGYKLVETSTLEDPVSIKANIDGYLYAVVPADLSDKYEPALKDTLPTVYAKDAGLDAKDFVNVEGIPAEDIKDINWKTGIDTSSSGSVSFKINVVYKDDSIDVLEAASFTVHALTEKYAPTARSPLPSLTVRQTAPETAEAFVNTDGIPAEKIASITWFTKPMTSLSGSVTAKIIVTYIDGSTDEITSEINVIENPKSDSYNPKAKSALPEVFMGDSPNAKDFVDVEGIPKEEISSIEWLMTPDTSVIGDVAVKVIITYSDTSYDIVEITMTVSKKASEDPEKDAKEFAELNDKQLISVKELIEGGKGSSSAPEYVNIKQAIGDTAVVKTGFVKGKPKSFIITGLDEGRTDIVNINAGAKVSIEGKYEITEVSFDGKSITDEKAIKKIAKAKAKSANTMLSTKAGAKYPDSYTVTLNGDKGKLVIIVNNLAISKEEGKLTLSSSNPEVKRLGLKTVGAKKTSGMAAVIWMYNKKVVPTGEKNALTISSKKGDIASMYVDAETGEVVVTPIKDAVGKIKLTASLNGKQFKANINVVK